MNRTIILTTLRERFSAPNRWFAAALLFAIPILTSSAPGAGARMPFLDVILVWLVGAGIIGEEISTGTILLVLSRPVTRRAYVLSKWAALAILSSGIFLAQAALGWALAVYLGRTPEITGVLAGAGQSVLRGCGAAAVLMPFSVAIAGGKEISAIMLGWALGSILEVWGKLKEWPWLVGAGNAVTRFLIPTVNLTATGTGFSSLPGQTAIFVLTVAGALAAAILLLERRELSYSAG